MFPKLCRCIEVSYTSSNKLDEKLFLKEMFFVPSIGEQKKIGTFFQTLDRLIDIRQRKLAKLEKLKKALLSKMFV